MTRREHQAALIDRHVIRRVDLGRVIVPRVWRQLRGAQRRGQSDFALPAIRELAIDLRPHLAPDVHCRHLLGERTGIDRAEIACREYAEVLIGEAQNLRLVTHERTTMLVDAEPAIRRDVVAERVRDGVAFVEDAACMNQLLQRVTADLMRVEVFIPLS